MDRQMLSKWLRTRPPFQKAPHPHDVAAADLIDEQAARIAELQELAEAYNAALIRAEKAEARADAAWCAGRDAAADAIEKAPTVNVQAEKNHGWEVLVTTPTVPYPQMIRALTPPENKP